MKFVFLLIVSTLLLSCGAMKNEMWIENAAGGGRTVFRADMGELVKGMEKAMTSMFDTMEDMSKEDNSKFVEDMPAVEEIPVVEQAEDIAPPAPAEVEVIAEESFDTSVEEVKPLSPFDNFFNLSSSENIDSTVKLNTLYSKEVMSKVKNSKLLENIFLHVYSNKNDSTSFVDVDYRYSSISEFEKLSLAMAEVEFFTNGDSTNLKDYEVQKNTIFFDGAKKTLKVSPYNATQLSAFNEFSSQFMQDESFQKILESMGMQKVEYTYHLPGTIKKVEGVEYKILDDKKSVVVYLDGLAIIKNGKTPSYSISYE